MELERTKLELEMKKIEVQARLEEKTVTRILSYRTHFRTSSATCRLDCVNVLNV